MVVIGALVATTATARTTSTTPLAYGGDAYGSFVSVGRSLLSGSSAPVGMGCVSSPGYDGVNRIGPVSLPGVMSVASAGSDTRSLSTSQGRASTSSEVVTHVRLLAGLITVKELKAVSTTTDATDGFHVSSAGTEMTGLTVAGRAIKVMPGANTRIAVPGVGTLVLNERTESISPSGAVLTINLIDFTIDRGVLGARAGTQIILGHAMSALAPGTTGPTVSGIAYGTYAQTGDVLDSGPGWAAGMCDGTGGKLVTNSTHGVTIPGVLSTGAVLDTAQGAVSSTRVAGVTSSTVNHVSLFGGLIHATMIRATAAATRTRSGLTTSDAGSEFQHLVIAGKSIVAEPGDNTEISIGNLHVWLHRVSATATGLTVTMLEVTVSGANPYGLANGTDLRLATALIGA